MITAIVLLVVASLGESLTLSVNITPEDKILQTRQDSLTVRCVADEPITHCELRVDEYNGFETATADLSRGSLSNVSHFTYEGDGLSAGHCGATIGPEALPQLLVSHGFVHCRVRTSENDWVYATMTLMISPGNEIPVTVEPRLVVARPGEDVQLLVRAEELLNDCVIIRPRGIWITLTSRTTCNTEADSFCYHGQGLSNRECGANIKNITDRSNGMHRFLVQTSSGWKFTHVQVIVAKPPSAPVLSANTTVNADGTRTLRAVCTVAGSRPAANITWMLDEEIVTGGKIHYIPSKKWVKQYEDQTITQQLTLKIDDTMHGKDLACIANHVALASPISSNKFPIVRL